MRNGGVLALACGLIITWLLIWNGPARPGTGPFIPFAVGAFIFLAAWIRWQRIRRTSKVNFNYENGDALIKAATENLAEAFRMLGTCSGLWWLDSNFTRHALALGLNAPSHFRSNVPMHSLCLGRSVIWFLPHIMLMQSDWTCLHFWHKKLRLKIQRMENLSHGVIAPEVHERV
jgi:hypothetical protein